MPGSESPSAVRSTGVKPRFAVVRNSLSESVRAEAARLLDQVDGTVGVVVAMNRRGRPAVGSPASATGSWPSAAWRPRGWSTTRPSSYRRRRSPTSRPPASASSTSPSPVATQQLTVVSAERDEPDANGVPDLLRD
ncbi:hypothetical protein ACRAWF_10495 [Streptomyces sp. L7]